MWMDQLTNTEVFRDTKILIIVTDHTRHINDFKLENIIYIVCEIIKYNF